MPSTPRELRDHAMVAMLVGCGLRRAELLALRLESIQQCEEHWAQTVVSLLDLDAGRPSVATRSVVKFGQSTLWILKPMYVDIYIQTHQPG